MGWQILSNTVRARPLHQQLHVAHTAVNRQPVFILQKWFSSRDIFSKVVLLKNSVDAREENPLVRQKHDSHVFYRNLAVLATWLFRPEKEDYHVILLSSRNYPEAA